MADLRIHGTTHERPIGIFALFGAPVAHEDHPRRALYAGLRMQEELRRYSAKLREGGNRAVEARVGVNTGEVVVRSIRTGETHTEYTQIGHSTSLASRMQALAPTASIAATAQVRKLCEAIQVDWLEEALAEANASATNAAVAHIVAVALKCLGPPGLDARVGRQGMQFDS